MKITKHIQHITRGLERASHPAEEDEPAMEVRIGEIVGTVLIKFNHETEEAYTVISITRRYPLPDEPSKYNSHAAFYENDFECYQEVFDMVQAFVKKLAEVT